MPVLSRPIYIDGGGTITISGGNARRIFVVASTGALALERLVLTNGFTSGDGGAILADGVVLLQDSAIRSSVAGLSGGALVAPNAVIQDSELDSNKARYGGAIFIPPSGVAAVLRSWIHDNEATNTTDGWGGGIYLSDEAFAQVEDSLLSGNFAETSGAGIFGGSDESLVLKAARVVDNDCKGGGGAGIHFNGEALSIEDSEASFNDAVGGGGGLLCENCGALAISRSTFEGNSRSSSGGALRLTNCGAVALENVTISRNDAVSAGAMRSENSLVGLSHVTVASNEGAGSGAITSTADNDRILAVDYVLLSDNQEPNIEGTSIVSTGTNVSDDDSGEEFLVDDRRSAETLLGPIGQNGGLTRTHVPGPGSEAVDIEGTGSSVDQRGIVRPQGPSFDAGSVEVVSCDGVVAVCGDANENGSISSSDALKALRTAVDIEECALWFCDYDGNKNVSSADALGILRASVGQPTSPSCPPPWDCRLA